MVPVCQTWKSTVNDRWGHNLFPLFLWLLSDKEKSLNVYLPLSLHDKINKIHLGNEYMSLEWMKNHKTDQCEWLIPQNMCQSVILLI